LAVELITSGQVFFTIFDNINIFLRKSQQRISNTNNMINATNVAIVGINGVEPFTEADLAEPAQQPDGAVRQLRNFEVSAQRRRPQIFSPRPRTTKSWGNHLWLSSPR
jgi:hypothetical protein